jgi:hypothetical protein
MINVRKPSSFEALKVPFRGFRGGYGGERKNGKRRTENGSWSMEYLANRKGKSSSSET